MSVIELPDWAVPNGAEPFPIPFGYWLTPATGAEEGFIDRMGGRWGATLTFPPMIADRARVLISRLSEAWFSGEVVRVDYPLAGVSQGSPGSPVIDGGGQSGKVINFRGFNSGYAVREGYWLTLFDADGRGYLHNNRTSARVEGDGLAELRLSPMLRAPLVDGATASFAKPTIEGKVSAQPWQIPVNRLFQVGFGIREIA